MAAEDAGREREPEHSSDIEISVIPVEEQPLPRVSIYESVVGLAYFFNHLSVVGSNQIHTLKLKLSSPNTIQQQRTLSSAGGPCKNRGSQGVYVRQHNETTFTTLS